MQETIIITKILIIVLFLQLSCNYGYEKSEWDDLQRTVGLY